MSEPSLEQRLLISDEAKRLLSDPLFNSVVSSLVKDYMQDLMKTRPGSPEGLVAHSSLNALEDIKSRLKALENDGVVIRKKLEKESAARGGAFHTT